MMEEAFSEGYVSLGGLTVGSAILIWTFIQWWNETPAKSLGKKFSGGWRSLFFPFVPLMIYGMLLILSAGGVLGGIANFTLWGSNQIGRVVIEYGVGGDDPEVTRTTSLVLENGGHAVVALMTVAFVAVWVFNKHTRKKDLILPIICGICLGLSDGIAGWAARVLAPAVDSAGGLFAGIL